MLNANITGETRTHTCDRARATLGNFATIQKNMYERSHMQTQITLLSHESEAAVSERTEHEHTHTRAAYMDTMILCGKFFVNARTPPPRICYYVCGYNVYLGVVVAVNYTHKHTRLQCGNVVSCL